MKELTELETMNVEFLSDKEIPFTTVLLTENILNHSIFDATRQMVVFLRAQSIHDYAQQEKGKDNRKFVPTHILTFKEEFRHAPLFIRQALVAINECGSEQRYFQLLTITIWLPLSHMMANYL